MNKKFFKSELAKGSILLLVTMGLFNFLNLLFHFISGRLLGEVLYGTFAALMGIVYLFNVPSEAIQTIMSKYTTKAENHPGKIRSLLEKGLRKFFILGIICLLVFLAFSPWIGKFLSIEVSLVMLTGIFILVIFIVSVNRGILQGLKKFSSLGLNSLTESAIKLGLGILLILGGMKIYGALIGLVIGGIIAFLVSFISLKEIILAKKEGADTQGMRSYSIPTFISIAVITLFYSIDLILAKKFFPEIAGQYAVISMLGKIIFFGTSPIGKAMFPLASERNQNKQNSKGLLIKSFLFVLSLAIIAMIIYAIFPTEIISLLYGEKFLELAKYLLLPSIAMTFLSLSNIFIYHNLSKNEKHMRISLVFFVILQISILSIFHNNLLQFMLANIGGNLILFLFLVLKNIFKK